MRSTDRPLSPHLQVYRPQLTSVLSITHRGTGVALVFGSVLLVYWLLALAAGPEAYERANMLFSHSLVKLVLFGFSFALFYHLCNGVRHLFWDAGLGLEIEQAYRSGYAALAAAAVLTLLTWLAVFLG